MLASKLFGLKQHMVLFILNMEEKHLLPKVTQDTIVPNLKFILQFFFRHYADYDQMKIMMRRTLFQRIEEMNRPTEEVME